MRRVIALFGPPGVGKSTLVKLAKRKSISAYDLEEEANNKENRKIVLIQLLKKDTSNLIVFGSADLGPQDYPESTETILLLPPKKHYLQRVEKRDQEVLEKKGQNALHIYDLSVNWQSHFDKVIQGVAEPEETLNAILSSSS